MKIILLSPLPPPVGGIAEWTRKYMVYCNNNGLEVKVIDTSVNGKRKEKLYKKRNLFDELKRAWKIIYELKELLNRRSTDIVHINSSCTNMGIIRDGICAFIAKRYGVKVLFHCRCNIEDQLSNIFGKWLFFKIEESVDKTIVLNKKSYNFATKIGKDKTIRLPNFIESKKVAETHVINDKIRKILYVGHVKIEKGIREIYECAKMFPHIQFELVGKVMNDMKDYDSPPNVIFYGEQTSKVVRHRMLEADIFLFPTYSEGFSNALLEAMAAGLPIITTDVGANKEMLCGLGGEIVNVRDSNGIIEAINKMDNSIVRKRMSEYNISRVKEKYLLDSVMNRLVYIYKDVIKE